MPTPSLQVKRAYYAKARQSNYAASLRLESFDTTPADAEHFGDLSVLNPHLRSLHRSADCLSARLQQ
ncbi:YhfG family protein [Pseudomonas sp. D(2018)]|uniref:YhfG family protein n=1 Tax=Pseudomonas sp. D(2018) TaxID=2502238 RepID=UPI002113AD88|nr:YhfG family protein [Pseudomonas sp. D(2018)]